MPVLWTRAARQEIHCIDREKEKDTRVVFVRKSTVPNLEDLVYCGGMGETGMLVTTGSIINRDDTCRINPIDDKVYPITGTFANDNTYTLYSESFLRENETAVVIGNKIFKQVQG